MRAEYVEAARLADLASVAQQVRPMALPYRIQYALSAVLPRFLFQPIARLMLRVHIFMTYRAF